MPGNRQPQPDSTVRPRERGVALIEPVPDTIDLVVLHANARIYDRHPQAVARLRVRAKVHRDQASLGGELERIVHVAPQRVRELFLVGIDASSDPSGDRQAKIDALAFRLGLQLLNVLPHYPRQLDGPQVQSLDARLKACEVEQTVDE